MRETSKGMSLIVKTITSWVKGLIFLFGLYIIFFGHLTPGGGFPGGVIIAASYILLTLGFGSEFSLKNISKAVASELDSIGALLFLVIATLGIFMGNAFFINYIHKFHPGENFRFLSAGTIPLCNIAVGLKVGMCLFMVFIILSVVRVITKDELK
jgi:multicomponent Na+:H+ antiporter subunit B